MTIHEVSREYGITPDTLRYYEKEGDDLIIAARRKENLERLKREILQQYPERDVIIRVCDLSDNDETIALYESLREYDIKCLINNAGRSNRGGFYFTAKQMADMILALYRSDETVGTIDFATRTLRLGEGKHPHI